MLLGGLALGAFVALVVGFIVHHREQPAPNIDVAEPGPAATADKPSAHASARERGDHVLPHQLDRLHDLVVRDLVGVHEAQ
jgi:hypothetical protein